MDKRDIFTLEELLGLEDYIGLLTKGSCNPNEVQFAEDVPLDLISAWKHLYNARAKMNSVLDSIKSENK